MTIKRVSIFLSPGEGTSYEIGEGIGGMKVKDILIMQDGRIKITYVDKTQKIFNGFAYIINLQ